MSDSFAFLATFIADLAVFAAKVAVAVAVLRFLGVID